ncbi:response regulator receiver protein [Anaeromyxobacter sp. K]|uniref:DUF4388 domain-containing protein n=1 Tax=Anaeromyxobacter sp. (strain K) TaxID=447217 RepID=UPI00017BE1CF|nr:DUF4388 domain-containing protein [Anaeromyxobacter sp. K]ACG73120.1 response regulator receiver protein [Anaeromyxobacter sp. K]
MNPSPFPRRLLVLSEDAALAGLVAGAAVRLGAAAEAVGSGRAALQALARGGARAAVLDLPVADVGAGELLAAFGRAGVPALVVSGVYRGRQGEAALRRLGAREVFEKPFDVDALAAAVARRLGTHAPSPAPEEAPDEVTGALPLPPGEGDPAPLAAPPLPALDLPPAAARPAPPAAHDAFLTPLPETRHARATAPEPAPASAGELSATRVPRLLVALHVGQASGALTLTRGPVRRIVVVERGAPVYAASNVAAERFGAVAVRRGAVTAERLEALRRAAPPGARTSDLLVEAGVITPDQRVELLTGLVRAVAWSTFEWRDGTYAFQHGRPPAGRVPLRLDPAEVILDGIRRTASPERLREDLPGAAHLAPVPDPAFELYALRLRPEEARLLALADGTKSVDDLLRLTELPARDARAFLAACRTLRVLDEVERVLASTRRIGFM